ncbi:hypothetical protein [Paraferrimonas haliotis]|uniref:HTH cro/C1-type domain-containing protein n=1 Tax=Paraferrimonas haliotis TaxID=2013866 RepID=A0AA37WYM3_9GAMM|nr:hypothetical protein [Paraferrimonas haliotis]GLS84604.1 hypothetical protein GCM10007894_25810 [Paraferrimonas haliotis]
MVDLESLFNQYKKSKRLLSDKAMAESMGISTAYFCDIKKGRRRLSDKLALDVAKELGLEPGLLLLELRVNYAKQAEEKLAWKKIILQWQRNTR